MAVKRLKILGDLRGIEAYVAVVETSSITRAAHRLGILPSTVSKKIAELEDRAQARLLHRTTRRISLTEVGRKFYDQSLRILNEAERGEWELRDHAGEPSGRIRVTAPVVFAQRHLSPLVPEFLRRYPAIDLELTASAKTLNLVEEGFDLSIRIARADQVGRGSRILAPNRRVVCAAPDYLARFGTPQTPEDLAEHSCLVALSTQRSDVWRFTEGAETVPVRIKGQLAADNALILAEAAAQGVGIALLGTFVVGQHLDSGALVEILPGCVKQDSAFVAVFPEQNHTPHRVSLFLDYLATAIGEPPIWDQKMP